jgi:hypothetical protein
VTTSDGRLFKPLKSNGCNRRGVCWLHVPASALRWFGGFDAFTFQTAPSAGVNPAAMKQLYRFSENIQYLCLFT